MAALFASAIGRSSQAATGHQNLPTAGVSATGSTDVSPGLVWSRRIVIEASNSILFPDLKPAEPNGWSSSELVAELIASLKIGDVD